jgi:hypothetical protein
VGAARCASVPWLCFFVLWLRAAVCPPADPPPQFNPTLPSLTVQFSSTVSTRHPGDFVIPRISRAPFAKLQIGGSTALRCGNRGVGAGVSGASSQGRLSQCFCLPCVPHACRCDTKWREGMGPASPSSVLAAHPRHLRCLRCIVLLCSPTGQTGVPELMPADTTLFSKVDVRHGGSRRAQQRLCVVLVVVGEGGMEARTVLRVLGGRGGGGRW